MKITVLLENTASDDRLLTEHGLSLYIETSDHKILFDAGHTDLFAKNAEMLGIDLSEADIAVISHGHFDHGGGLKTFLDINSKAPVYINRLAFEPYYSPDDMFIGLDRSLSENGRIIYNDDMTVIDDDISLYSCNNQKRMFEIKDSGLKMMKDSMLVSDDFRHEHYMLVKEAGKSVLFSGCSHKGIMNIADWFKPDVLVGGFHFMMLQPGDEIVKYAKQLNSMNISYFTCHCTGLLQYEHMKPYMDRLSYISTGQTIEI